MTITARMCEGSCSRTLLLRPCIPLSALSAELRAAVSAAVLQVAVIASGLAKSLVGVAGGATRAAIAQHQALRSNMADLAVKVSTWTGK